MTPPPRVVVAGLAGDTGKSLVTLGLLGALRARGQQVEAFKKGPDYIDAAWLGLAAGSPARNLDTFLMPEPVILASFLRARGADLALVEGNRGLFDGVDGLGTHSTARLARLLQAPVVLVLDASRATATLAALVLGCGAMDPDLWLGGVILNRVSSPRHEAVIRQALSHHTGVPVLGAVPRIPDPGLPSRHLGLVPPSESPQARATLEALAQVLSRSVDLDALLTLARQAPPLPVAPRPTAAASGTPVRLGVLRDPVFSFYYPENLEALEREGAHLVFLSPLQDQALPPLDGLYAGGGFPEARARELSDNAAFRGELAERIAAGLPTWAECGGLTYLSRELVSGGQTFPMVGALPIAVEHGDRLQGHGYVQGEVDGANPFLAVGTPIVGHEHHHGHLVPTDSPPPSALRLSRGQGLGHGRDGIHHRSVVATWTHLHALATPSWAPGLVAAARRHREEALH